jgi:hypothetical protein
MKTNEIINELKKAELTEENIEVIFDVLENQAAHIDGFTAPWTPQAKRSDLKLRNWMNDNKADGKTFEEIAEGFSEVYKGVTEETIKQIVEKDQTNLKVDSEGNKKDFRKFSVKDGKVFLRVKAAKMATIKLIKK